MNVKMSSFSIIESRNQMLISKRKGKREKTKTK